MSFPFENARYSGLQIAASEVLERTAEYRILVSPGSVHVSRLQKSDETCIDAIDRAGLIWFEHILPVAGPTQVLLVVLLVPQFARQHRYAKIVIGVFDSARYGARFSAHAEGVVVLCGDVT